MPQPLENILMQKYGLRYSDARKIVNESRERLGLPKNSRAWTPALYDDCATKCGTVDEGEELDTECTDNPTFIMEAEQLQKSPLKKMLEDDVDGDSDGDVACYISIPLANTASSSSLQTCLPSRFQKAGDGLRTPSFGEDDDSENDEDLAPALDDLTLSNHSYGNIDQSENSENLELQLEAFCDDVDDDITTRSRSSASSSLKRERPSLFPTPASSKSSFYKKTPGKVRRPSASEDTSTTDISDYSEDYVLRVMEVPARGLNRNSSDLSLKVTRHRRRSVRKSLPRQKKEAV